MTGAPLWRGRALALVAIVLVALNLRTAVAALSPIVDEVSADIALGSVGLGLLGMLPPVCFAVVGLFAPALHRRFGLEPVMIAALVAILLGHLARGASGSYLLLVLASALTFAGMGVANVLLPPLVKSYFPDRIGLITSIYATTMALGATIPPLVAVPIADSAGWRVSLGVWAVLSVVALLPMTMLTLAERRGRTVTTPPVTTPAVAPPPDTTETGSAPASPGAPVPPERPARGRVWRSPLAWSLMVVFGLTAFNSYAMFAWLPSILIDVAGVTPGQAGALLSLYSVMGLPASLVVPVLAVRLRSVRGLIAAGVVFYLLGYGGLLLAPGAAPWLWVSLAGLGPMLFPLALVLINLRTRTHQGSVALSSFVQSFGYALGAVGPLLVGVLHDVSGGWTPALVMLLATTIALVICGIVVAKPRMLEDQWHN